MILATSLLENIHQEYPDAQIDFLLRKGNESLFTNHPFLNEVFILDRKNKLKSLPSLISKIRGRKYDVVVNAHRFGSSGLIAWLSGAKQKFGFEKNPFSFSYTKSYPHLIGNGEHEIHRNHQLISTLTAQPAKRSTLYPSEADYEKVETDEKYIVLAPASIWFTKQLPFQKWMELIAKIPKNTKVYLIGAPSDKDYCQKIIDKSARKDCINYAGNLSLLQSAALMEGSYNELCK